MTTHKKIKTLKPIEIDAHFKYRCPKCASDHWISLNEAKTKNFKIVCHCSKILKPKRISNIKISYHQDAPVVAEKCNTSIDPIVEVTNVSTNLEKEQIDPNVLEKCTNTLVGYGFTKQEAQDLIIGIYETSPSNDCGQLIKQALKSFGSTK